MPVYSQIWDINRWQKMKKRISSKNTDQNLAIKVRVSAEGAAEIEVNQSMWDDPDIWGTLLSEVAVCIAENYATGAKKKKFMGNLEKSFSRDIQDAIQQW